MDIISDAEIRRLGRAYLDGKDEGNSRAIRSMTESYADRVQRDFRALTKKIDVIFVDRDPYKSFGELENDVLVNRRMYVYAGFSMVPWWSPEVNMMGSAVHDWDHIELRAQFTPADEIRIFQRAYDRTPQLEPLLMSEIALQASSTIVLGKFDDVQKIVLPSDEIAQIARRRMNPSRASGRSSRPTRRRRVTKRAASFVWDAAGALKYMSPEDVMRVMGARGVPMRQALAAGAAAQVIPRAPAA